MIGNVIQESDMTPDDRPRNTDQMMGNIENQPYNMNVDQCQLMSIDVNRY